MPFGCVLRNASDIFTTVSSTAWCGEIHLCTVLHIMQNARQYGGKKMQNDMSYGFVRWALCTFLAVSLKVFHLTWATKLDLATLKYRIFITPIWFREKYLSILAEYFSVGPTKGSCTRKGDLQKRRMWRLMRGHAIHYGSQHANIIIIIITIIIIISSSSSNSRMVQNPRFVPYWGSRATHSRFPA